MQGRDPTPRRAGIERLWQPALRPLDYPLWLALTPASAAFRAGVAMRHLFWRFFRTTPAIPTISVGNLTVGGNSKTPFTLFLANRLRDRGRKVAILSRGYGAKSADDSAALVSLQGELKVSIDEAGDEPAMMARSFDGPIVVARRRIKGIDLLEKMGSLDAVILDDGFQHVRLARAVDLVLVNAENGFGNGWMLPAGPMREPIRAAHRADAAIVVDRGPGQPSAITSSQMKRLAGAAKVLHASVRPSALIVPENGRWRETPAPLANRPVLAVSGIANPAGFYAMLHELEADLTGVLEYPDHHDYSAADWQAIVAAARNADLVVTTEKDLVKLERFPFARDSLCALRLEVKMNDDDARELDTIVLEGIDAAKDA
jgi:tetraacyldisaccharide 4'-kinase